MQKFLLSDSCAQKHGANVTLHTQAFKRLK